MVHVVLYHLCLSSQFTAVRLMWLRALYHWNNIMQIMPIAFQALRTCSWWQQGKQNITDICLPQNAFWLLRGEPEACMRYTYNPFTEFYVYHRVPLGNAQQDHDVLWMKSSLEQVTLDAFHRELGPQTWPKLGLKINMSVFWLKWEKNMCAHCLLDLIYSIRAHGDLRLFEHSLC